ncbi:MAG: hypothetical protein JOY77_12220 [Alphaproteobacteria bacterium]|nr:hypothetical protein [Alphaproteobacteria bacterium]MBV9063676.1 hypothetical protein [Alphaproteobacteria bacterium]
MRLRNPVLTHLLPAAATLALAASHAYAASNAHDKALKLPPGVSTGTCQENAAAYSVSTDLQKTSSRNFQDVSGTTVSFTQGAAGCVEVSFSSEAATVPGEILVTQALLDGTACLPSDNLFASDSPSSDLAAHAMNYICPNAGAGAHTVKVQFRSRYGHKVALDYRTTVVRYAQ